MARASETAKGAADHRERASGRSTAEDLGGGKIWSGARCREEAGLPAGEIFSPDRLGAAPAGSSAYKRHAGTGLRKSTGRGDYKAFTRAPRPKPRTRAGFYPGHPSSPSRARRRAARPEPGGDNAPIHRFGARRYEVGAGGMAVARKRAKACRKARAAGCGPNGQLSVIARDGR